MNELVGSNGIMNISNFKDAMDWAKIISGSDFCPSSYRKNPEQVLLAMQYGYELGLKPLQALQNIAVINGKPSIYGDAMLALVKASGELEDMKELIESGPEGLTACCTLKRRGETEHTVRFSEKQAKLANLWGKSGPWKTYPERMLQMRARGFAIRDVFPHLMKGLISVEEAQDYDVEKKAIKIDGVNNISIGTSCVIEPVQIENCIKIPDYHGKIHEMLCEFPGERKDKFHSWLYDKFGASLIEDLSDEQSIEVIRVLEKQANVEGEGK